jgi:uncharacterized membrane protein
MGVSNGVGTIGIPVLGIVQFVVVVVVLVEVLMAIKKKKKMMMTEKLEMT